VAITGEAEDWECSEEGVRGIDRSTDPDFEDIDLVDEPSGRGSGNGSFHADIGLEGFGSRLNS
jgi:hypothetical protein